MPWKETCPMDERLGFIARVNATEHESFAGLCRAFGISRKTGYKWLARYEQEGPAGLAARAPVAHAPAHAIAPTVLDALVTLRKEHPTWGPKKLRAWLQARAVAGVPAASTIGTILSRHGLIRPRRRRVYAPAHGLPLEDGERPNDLWCIDFKGWFVLGDKARCYPLTVTDHYSRYLLQCEALAGTTEPVVRAHLTRAFHEFGMPLRIRSDHGPPFASRTWGGLSQLSIWWIKLGVTPERIAPGAPQENGRHERMHRTLQADACMPPGATRVAQQRAFDRHRRVFNDERPHEALGQKPPASVYCLARRTMPATLRSPDYPSHYDTRRLDDHGRLRFGGHKTLITPLLAGEPVGLEPFADGRWLLHYGPVGLAEVHLEANKEVRLTRLDGPRRLRTVAPAGADRGA